MIPEVYFPEFYRKSEEFKQIFVTSRKKLPKPKETLINVKV